MTPARVLAGLAVAFVLLVSPALAAASTPQSDLLGAVNAYRASHGVRTLAYSPRLSSDSRSHARWMLRQDVFGHTRINVAGFRDVGEVLAIYRGRSVRIRWMMSSWDRSPSHRQVLLNGAFDRAGIAREVGVFRGRRMTVWVLRLGRLN